MPAENLSADPVRFAYWVPHVSGGLVTSTIEQRTVWGYDYNRELAVLAENTGFDSALGQVRCTAGHGAEFQHEPTGFSSPCCSPPGVSGPSRRSTRACGGSARRAPATVHRER